MSRAAELLPSPQYRPAPLAAPAWLKAIAPTICYAKLLLGSSSAMGGSKTTGHLKHILPGPLSQRAHVSYSRRGPRSTSVGPPSVGDPRWCKRGAATTHQRPVQVSSSNEAFGQGRCGPWKGRAAGREKSTPPRRLDSRVDSPAQVAVNPSFPEAGPVSRQARIT